MKTFMNWLVRVIRFIFGFGKVDKEVSNNGRKPRRESKWFKKRQNNYTPHQGKGEMQRRLRQIENECYGAPVTKIIPPTFQGEN